MLKKAIKSAAAIAMLAAAGGVQADLGRTVGVTCNGCHGTDGVSAGSAPSLKGLPASHIEASMKDFRSGKRPATIMGRIAKGYNDEQIAAMASYFADMK